jgi:phosphohistidine phosphatase
MRLYVMRHGPAEDRASSGRDFDRQLTPAGREVVRRVADAFQAARSRRGAAAEPLRIITSPRARAQETAAIVRSALVPVPTPESIAVAPELGGEAAIPLALIVEAAASGVDTLLVGHQPVVEELVKQLLGATPKHLGFATATIVGLDLEADGATWTLADHLDPSRLPG